MRHAQIIPAPAQLIPATAQLIPAPTQLITAPAQPPATEVVLYTALFSHVIAATFYWRMYTFIVIGT